MRYPLVKDDPKVQQIKELERKTGKKRLLSKKCQQFLSKQQKIFCVEYLKTGDISGSARIANYKIKNPQKILDLPVIQAYLAKNLVANVGTVKFSKDWYIAKLALVIDGGITDCDSTSEERSYATREALMAGDQLCRLVGYYAPEKHINLNTNVSELKELLVKVKERERGY